MTKGRILKGIVFILILLVICVAVFFMYYRITGKTNPLSEIFNNDNKNVAFDNYNGFYVYSDDLGKSYTIYNGCVVSNIDYQILVIGDKFKLYKESCIGTYLLESGNTKDLDFQEDNENKLIYFDYKDNRYYKKNEISSVILGNTFLKNTKKIDVSGYKFLIEQSEFEGNYYDIKDLLIDGTSDFKFGLYHDGDTLFHITLGSKKMHEPLFTSDVYSDVKEMPDLYVFGKIVAVVTPYKVGGRYRYDFSVYGIERMIYSIYEQFPIEINGYNISPDDNFYISFQQNSRTFYLLVAPRDSTLKNVFCEDDNDSGAIAYYMFSIKYDYSKVNFGSPQYEKVGYVKDGCSYVNTIMGG